VEVSLPGAGPTLAGVLPAAGRPGAGARYTAEVGARCTDEEGVLRAEQPGPERNRLEEHTRWMGEVLADCRRAFGHMVVPPVWGHICWTAVLQGEAGYKERLRASPAAEPSETASPLPAALAEAHMGWWTSQKSASREDGLLAVAQQAERSRCEGAHLP
jgi:hypothetical protein